MSENLENRAQKEQCTSNQVSEPFVFNDPLPWEDSCKSEPEKEDCYEPESDPVTDYLKKEDLSFSCSDETYEEKPKFYFVDGLRDRHAIELAAAIKKLDSLMDKCYRIKSTLNSRISLVYLVEHLNCDQTKELLEYSDKYLSSLDDLNVEIRLFSRRIEEVTGHLKLIAGSVEKIKEIEGKMKLSFVSEENYNDPPYQNGD